MNANILEQQSLLDAGTFEASKIYHTEARQDKALKHSLDYLVKRFFGQDKNAAQSFEQVACIASRMTQLLDVLPGGVIVLDGNGIVQQCNVAAIDLLGEPIEGEQWVNIIQRAFKPKSTDGHDSSLADGRLVHISTSPLKAEPGQIILLQDVTETRALQHQVSHLQRLSAMGEMAARLAHQIRTPLSTALLYLSPLLKKEGDTELKQRFAKRLHKSISHMEHLVKDMLAFSRGDMAETGPVLVDELVASVEQQFVSQPDVECINFSIEINTAESCVYGSHDALSSAINNLVNNARLACDEQGEITVYSNYVEDDAGIECIEISVKDNGRGIDKESLDKVLTPFYTTRSSGTGLGLAVVQSIAKAHKGELWFESVAGEGSTFFLRLPMYQAAENFTLTAQKK